MADAVIDRHAHGKGNALFDGAPLYFVAVDTLGKIDDQVIACLADVQHNGSGHAHVSYGFDDGITDDSTLLVLGDNIGVGCGR